MMTDIFFQNLPENKLKSSCSENLVERYLAFGSVQDTSLVRENEDSHFLELSYLAPFIKSPEARIVLTAAVLFSVKKECKDRFAIELIAACAFWGSKKIKQLAFNSVSIVCRTPAHLFIFITTYLSLGGGWGRAFKRSISSWYSLQDPEKLAFLLTKEWSGEGWSHRDVFRMAHPKPSPSNNTLYRWIATGDCNMPLGSITPDVLYVDAIQHLKHLSAPEIAASLIESFDLPPEVVPSKFLNSPEVWRALVPGMGYVSILKNLRYLSSSGLLCDPLFREELILTLLDEKKITRSKVHPLKLLNALLFYKRSRWAHLPSEMPPGISEDKRWEQEYPDLEQALKNAFNLSFNSIPFIHKSLLISFDVSSLMDSCPLGSSFLSCREASAFMSMLYARRSKDPIFYASSPQGCLKIESRLFQESFSFALQQLNSLDFNKIDCSFPILGAIEKNLFIDTFIIFTDSNPLSKKSLTFQAFELYKERVNPNAKLVVNSMRLSEAVSVSQDDPSYLGFSGFDVTASRIIRNFVNT